MSHCIGFNPNATLPAADLAREGKAHGLLDVTETHDGKRYIFVQANGAIAQYDAVGIDEAGQAAPLTKAMADDNWKIGIAQVAFDDDDYGWVQIYGPTTVNVLANCAADAALYTSGTAGSLDDDNTSQTLVRGITATAAVGGSAGEVAAFIAVEPSSGAF